MRVLCAAVSITSSEAVLILCGNSEGLLSVFLLPPSMDRLVRLGECILGTGKPILCLDSAAVTVDGFPCAGVAFAGTTDGNVTIVDLQSCISAAGNWYQAFAASGSVMGEVVVLQAVTGGDCLEVAAAEVASSSTLTSAPVGERTQKRKLDPSSDRGNHRAEEGVRCSDVEVGDLSSLAVGAALPVVHVYSAHEMGTNCVCVATLASLGNSVFLVATGGDDEALSASVVTVSIGKGGVSVLLRVS